MPVKLDHFVVTTMQRDEKKNLLIDTELMDSFVGRGVRRQGREDQAPAGRVPLERPRGGDADGVDRL